MHAASGRVADRQRALVAALAVLIAAVVAGQLAPIMLGGLHGENQFLKTLILGVGATGLMGVALRPDAGVLVLVALLTTNASEVMVRALVVPSPLQWLTAAVAAGLVLRVWRIGKGELSIVLDPLLVPLLLYVAVVFASSLGASEPDLSDQRLMEHLKGLLVFVVLTNAVRTRRQFKRVLYATVLAGAFLGSISLFQVATGRFDGDFLGFGQVKVGQIVDTTREPRISGPLTDPNFYAQLLVTIFPLALASLWDEVRPASKLLAGYGLFVITFAIVFTYSRGGAVAFGIVLLLALLSRRIRVRTLVAGLFASAALLLTVPSNFAGRLTTLGQVIPGISSVEDDGADSSFRQRRLFMAVAWEMFRDHELVGVGAGNYTERYQDYSSQVGSTQRSYDKFGGPYYPHSTPFEILAETGLAGLVTYAAIVFTAFAALARAIRAYILAGHRREAKLTVAIGVGLVGYLTTGILLHAHYVHTFWLLISFAAIARQVAHLTATGHDT